MLHNKKNLIYQSSSICADKKLHHFEVDTKMENDDE